MPHVRHHATSDGDFFGVRFQKRRNADRNTEYDTNVEIFVYYARRYDYDDGIWRYLK